MIPKDDESLSDKFRFEYLSIKDVKEAVKKLKEEFDENDWENNTLDVDKNRNKVIDKIFGKELI